MRQLLLAILVLVACLRSASATSKDTQDDDGIVETLKLELWSRGAFAFDEKDLVRTATTFARMDPISYVRRDVLQKRNDPACEMNGYCSTVNRFRGGGQDVSTPYTEEQLEQKIQEIGAGAHFGQEFLDAIEKNKKEHAEDCRSSCDIYYCASREIPLVPLDDLLGETNMKSYSMGAVPPEDFAENFGFPLDVIKVTETVPLFSADESARVVANAEAEGVDKNEFKSGKYKLAGDWLTNLPMTREWFNGRLESTFFPLLAHLFPEVISSPSVLRAHSVSLLKYNASHPRTDVHIDNGILALTLAMTPTNDYTGGGTYFEHMGAGDVLQMDVGHGTFRPGSVRHGGHRVTDGTRYILGAFLLLEDKVEHVRRLKNRGSELRRVPDLDGAAKHFEWALAMNPKCTTCLKDWAEILHKKKQFREAEQKIRYALELLENKDSDALFTLGLLLSEQGRDDESIEAYQQSVTLNAEDAELCYNLGIKLGTKGKKREEMKMYAKATKADPLFGGAWLNWGTALAEDGNLDDAELMFLKALECESDVVPKALMNLGLVYNTRGSFLAQTGDMPGAKMAALDAEKYIDAAKPLLDQLAASGNADSDMFSYIRQYRPLRLQCHRLLGQLHAGAGDMAASEAEFRRATQNFPDERNAWQMLGRVLEVQGKTEEMQSVIEKIKALNLPQ